MNRVATLAFAACALIVSACGNWSGTGGTSSGGGAGGASDGGYEMCADSFNYPAISRCIDITPEAWTAIKYVPAKDEDIEEVDVPVRGTGQDAAIMADGVSGPGAVLAWMSWGDTQDAIICNGASVTTTAFTPKVAVPLTAGETYWIAVLGNRIGMGGDIALETYKSVDGFAWSKDVALPLSISAKGACR